MGEWSMLMSLSRKGFVYILRGWGKIKTALLWPPKR